jgi:NAD(P)-dependent dehydrogenase (short-subunit alcohol dehydrogenase family)
MTRLDDSPIPDYQAMTRLDGRRILLLGAGQGIGRHSAHALAAAGAEVVCVDLDDGLAREVALEVKGIAVAADVRRAEDVQRIVTEATSSGRRLHGVVDIVGIGKFGSLLQIDEEGWRNSYESNFLHVTLVTRIMGQYLTSVGAGSIIFIGSISGIVSAPNHAAYGAFKAAIHALVKSAAVEFGPYGVRVNAVAPGLTVTPRLRAALTSFENVGRLGGLTEPRDVAAAVQFLSSDASRLITGQTLIVDAGQTLKYPVEVPSGIINKQSHT